MIIVKRALSRRTVLRGIGATVGLPLLDAMIPALTAAGKTAAKPIKRIGFIYQGNGVLPERYVPASAGKNFQFSRILKPLEPMREYLTVVSGLAHRQANSIGEGNGDHIRATAVWLTGVHAYDRKTSEVHLGTSVDQLIAQHIGKDTRLTSLELGIDGGSQIACDSTDCFYSNSISWRSPTTPNPVETNPRIVFERLFGEGSTAEERHSQRLKRRSILDSVMQETGRVKVMLGPSDQMKLTEYLDAIRDIERRIELAEKQAEGEVVAEMPTAKPGDLDGYWSVTCDLVVLAFRTDATRVASMLLARDNSSRGYPQIGIPEGGHSTSHHRRQPEMMEKRTKILEYHELMQSKFLEKLRSTPDGDGSLLDHSIIVSGQGMGDGDLHDHVNLPLWIAGKGAGTLSGNVHVAFAPEKFIPESNLWLTLMDKMDVPVPPTIGDSTAPLTI
jgi:hypothetical protein